MSPTTSAAATETAPPVPETASLGHEEQRVLRRLCETGAVLAVAADMDKAVVVRDSAGGSLRTAVVASPVAQALALKGWIGCDAPGRISRYRITGTGRQALAGMIGAQESRARGLAEAGAAFRHAGADGDCDAEAGRKTRFALADSPLAALARRRDRDGTPFLAEALVSAGERLREDYELAQMTDAALASATGGAALRGASAAKARLEQALADLGPGLSDVALRCCCQLEGLETAERRLGWSARSGKVVLRIALQRLRRHYERLGDKGAMIG
ncbi:DUF6456 domain-containing protein [Litorisediminicola beolgyonensis]|uniref:DUF6456 domain-containing protein n=1 Tax=Litorisediminicola beolgyonensis TaxID=1173614 RepID=A0ABW3ZF87_9RHOB